MKNVFVFAMLSLAIAVVGCEKAPEKPASKEATKPAASNPPATAKPAASPGHGVEVIDLGTTKIGAFEVRASRDKGDIKPGGEAPVDVWIDGGVGKGVAAVRFWIGTQDAKGSLKAKAGIEEGKWHTHVEIPSPIPPDTKLWIEIESEKGEKALGSLDLKQP